MDTSTIVHSLENPNQPLLGPNYWVLSFIGLVLPKNRFYKAMFICLHELITFFIITQYMELYVIRSDLDQILTNLKISMLSSVCIVKSNTFIFWQKGWKQVIDYVTQADQYERDSGDPEKIVIVEKYTKYCRRVTYFYWLLVFTTFVTVALTPLLHYVSSSTYREELRNGTELFPHIFSSWVPFDKYHRPGCWVTVLWHFFAGAYGATMTGAYDTSLIVFMVFFGGKLQLLRIRSREMFGSRGEGIPDVEFDKSIEQLYKMHMRLTHHSRLFNSLLSPVLFLYVVVCSLMLCASAYQLTLATNTTQKILMLQYLVFGIMQLFLFTWHSNDVMIESQKLSSGLYESEWWAANVRQRRNFLILAGQFHIKYFLKAGPFTNLTLSTFIGILKGAYSYFTLLRK